MIQPLVQAIGYITMGLNFRPVVGGEKKERILKVWATQSLYCSYVQVGNLNKIPSSRPAMVKADNTCKIADPLGKEPGRVREESGWYSEERGLY
jgi:hypothetical protein